MVVLLSIAGGLSAVALGVVAYAGWRMARLPAGNPAAVLAAGGPPTDRPVLVCLGDSIMQGGLGADWVGGLRERVGEGATVVNAGAPSELAWHLRQRLDAVARCRPDAIVLMVGSNDAVGALGGAWGDHYARGLPEPPSEAWFAAQYDALVGELVALAPRVVCLTLPPLGEDPDARAAGIARQLNETIRTSAERHGADLIDVHDALLARVEAGSSTRGVPFLSGISQFLGWGLGGAIRHHVLGQSWDRIAHGRGLALSADTIHPTEPAGAAIVDLVAPWAQRALAPRSTP